MKKRSELFKTVKNSLHIVNRLSRNSVTFVSTVLATLPVRTASQGESFAFKTFSNTPSLPLFDAHLGGFFMPNALGLKNDWQNEPLWR